MGSEMMRLRPANTASLPLLACLAVVLVLQITWRAWQPPPVPRAEALPEAPPQPMLRLMSLGDPVTASRLFMLWLQLYDNQPGISIPFRELDYARVEAWLAGILDLDPRSQYPLLAASRLYGAVPDPRRQRRMFDFVHRRFAEDPARRWRWLAHAVIAARHELHDDELALRYAATLAAAPQSAGIPSWARQMHIFVLEDMGHVEAARILLGGLLASGQVRDPHERYFLLQRLSRMEEGAQGNTQEMVFPADKRG